MRLTRPNATEQGEMPIEVIEDCKRVQEDGFLHPSKICYPGATTWQLLSFDSTLYEV